MVPINLSEKLESIRGLAAFVVFLGHTSQWFVLPLLGLEHGVAVVMGHCAHFSVLIFFALSGYLITNSLVLNYRKNGHIDSISYISSRLTRIVPPAITACIFSLLIGMLIIGAGLHGSDAFLTDSDLYVARKNITFSISDIVSTFLLSNGVISGTGPIVTNGPLWSLSIEFWAYFIALIGSVTVVMGRKKDHVHRNIAIVLAIGLMMLLALFGARPFEIMQYFLYWFIGCALYIRKRYPTFVNANFTIILLLASCSAFYSAVTLTPLDLVGERGSLGLLTIPIKATILIGLSLLVPYTHFFPLFRLFRRLGKSSYTLYVFHFPMLCFLFSLFHLRFLEWNLGGRVLFLVIVIFSITLICHMLARVLEDKTSWQRRFQTAIIFTCNIVNRIKRLHKRLKTKTDVVAGP